MKEISPYLIWGGIVFAFLALIFVPLLYKSSAPEGFVKCLTDSGVKMYGAFWCPHCIAQKELLGDSVGDLNYIECSLPDRSGQTQECNVAGIEGYPTWEFGDGRRVSGELSFRELSEYSGCPLE